MASSLAELVRPTQTSRSAAQQSAIASTAKPKTRFDDVLAQHRPAEPQASKADRSEPSAKADRSKKADAKTKKGDPSVDDARTPDDASTDAAPTEDAAVDEAETSKPAEKPGKAKPSKDAQKPGDNDEANADEVSSETTAAEGEPSATPVAELPIGEPVDEAEEIDADDKSVAKDEPADANSAVDPNALIAQLNQTQPLPTDEQVTPIDPTAGTGEIANVTEAAAKTQADATKAQAAATAAGPTDGEAELAIKPRAEKGHQAGSEELPTDADAFAGAIELPPELAKTDSKLSADVKLDPSAALQGIAAPHEKISAAHTSALPTIPTADAPVSPRTVAEENVDRIVTSIHGDIATKGGTMQIRLDPPSLGAINVQISIDDGVMSASLQTNNDEATRLLSHNLAQLKSQLESAGVTVDRIQVKQATPTEQSSNSNSQGDSGDRGQNRDAGQDQSARQEQQRREMLQRMWAKLAGNGDPLDLVA